MDPEKQSPNDSQITVDVARPALIRAADRVRITPLQGVFSKQDHQSKAPSHPNYDDEPPRPQGRELVLVFLGLSLALFLAALDGTIIATSLPTVGSEFHEYALVAWAINGYSLSFDAFQPLLSKLSDTFGRKPIVLFSIALFLIGSVLCGASVSMLMLIISRAVAGIGGAGIFSMVFICISDIIPLADRGKYQGIISAVFAMASVCGPLIGGSFTDHLSWRWNFYINLPFGGAAALILFFFLRLPYPKTSFIEKLKNIDYLGTFLVIAFATLFLLGLNFGGQTYPWASAPVISCLALSALLLAVLIWCEIYHAVDPIIPPHLFRIRTVTAVLILNWFFGLNFFTLIYYLPVFFQVVRGDDATFSGIRLIPMQIAISITSAGSGILISKLGSFRSMLWAGTATMTLGIGLISTFDLSTSEANIYGFTIIAGLGTGFLFCATIIAVQSATEVRDIATVTGLVNFFRILGGAVGIAVAAAILENSLITSLPTILPPDLVPVVINSVSFIREGLPKQFVAPVINAYVDGLRLVYLILIPMSGISFLASLFVQHHSLRRPAPRVQKSEGLEHKVEERKPEHKLEERAVVIVEA